MKGIRSSTRIELVRRVLGNGRRLTQRQCARAFRRLRDRGWQTAMPTDGPAYQKIAIVRDTHPLASLVEAYEAGERWFSVAVLEGDAGASIDTLEGGRILGRAGFAIVAYDGGRVQLRVTDPRAAVMVNEVRCGRQVRGYSVRRVLEAFLSIRDPDRTRLNVNDDRRVCSAQVLDEEWDIDCDDLLDGRRRVPWFRAECSRTSRPLQSEISPNVVDERASGGVFLAPSTN